MRRLGGPDSVVGCPKSKYPNARGVYTAVSTVQRGRDKEGRGWVAYVLEAVATEIPFAGGDIEESAIAHIWISSESGTFKDTRGNHGHLVIGFHAKFSESSISIPIELTRFYFDFAFADVG